MNSLRQIEPTEVRLGGKLRPLAVFDGASKIDLPPGVWMVGASGIVKWKYAPNVEIRCVLNGDVSSGVGPRTCSSNEGGTANGVIPWRGFSVFGPVEIPPDGEPVKLELMAALRGIQNQGSFDDEGVEFVGLQVFAMKIG